MTACLVATCLRWGTQHGAWERDTFLKAHTGSNSAQRLRFAMVLVGRVMTKHAARSSPSADVEAHDIIIFGGNNVRPLDLMQLMALLWGIRDGRPSLFAMPATLSLDIFYGDWMLAGMCAAMHCRGIAALPCDSARILTIRG